MLDLRRPWSLLSVSCCGSLRLMLVSICVARLLYGWRRIRLVRNFCSLICMLARLCWTLGGLRCCGLLIIRLILSRQLARLRMVSLFGGRILLTSLGLIFLLFRLPRFRYYLLLLPWRLFFICGFRRCRLRHSRRSPRRLWRRLGSRSTRSRTTCRLVRLIDLRRLIGLSKSRRVWVVWKVARRRRLRILTLLRLLMIARGIMSVTCPRLMLFDDRNWLRVLVIFLFVLAEMSLLLLVMGLWLMRLLLRLNELWCCRRNFPCCRNVRLWLVLVLALSRLSIYWMCRFLPEMWTL